MEPQGNSPFRHDSVGMHSVRPHSIRNLQKQLRKRERQRLTNSAATGQPRPYAGRRQQVGPTLESTEPDQNSQLSDFTPGDAAFDLNFSNSENADVLENFDFDSFLNSSADETFNFDNSIDIGNDFHKYASTEVRSVNPQTSSDNHASMKRNRKMQRQTTNKFKKTSSLHQRLSNVINEHSLSLSPVGQMSSSLEHRIASSNRTALLYTLSEDRSKGDRKFLLSAITGQHSSVVEKRTFLAIPAQTPARDKSRVRSKGVSKTQLRDSASEQSSSGRNANLAAQLPETSFVVYDPLNRNDTDGKPTSEGNNDNDRRSRSTSSTISPPSHRAAKSQSRTVPNFTQGSAKFEDVGNTPRATISKGSSIVASPAAAQHHREANHQYDYHSVYEIFNDRHG